MDGEPWIYHDGPLELRGEYYRPTVAPNGRAVLVVHEADGVGQNVRRRCAMLAALGYTAAAADMHGSGRVLAADEIAPALERFKNDAGLIRGRIGAAFAALAAETALPVAAIGYCFGGYAVLELARSGAQTVAVASFHGLLSSSAPASAGTIRTPIFVATGDLDPLVPPADVLAFEEEMRGAGANWHVLAHGRALHSFTNPGVDALDDPRMAYDPMADAISWAAALAFLDAAFSRSSSC